MQSSKVWKRIKKPVWVGITSLSSMVITFLCLHFSDGKAEAIFNEILSSFMVLTLFVTNLSVVLFVYVDNISKDVSAIEGNHSKIQIALLSLSGLKKEVILNAVLVFVLFVIERAIKGFAQPNNILIEDFYWVTSIRFSVFVLAILAAFDQIRGLIVAIDYRNVIHAGKNSNKDAN